MDGEQARSSEGPWYRTSCSFKLCGDADIRDFLLAGQLAVGRVIDFCTGQALSDGNIWFGLACLKEPQSQEFEGSAGEKGRTSTSSLGGPKAAFEERSSGTPKDWTAP
jgi:hypothetical protein